MKKLNYLTFILLSLSLLSACVPSSNTSNKRETSSSSASGGTSSDDTVTDPSFGSEVRWYDTTYIDGIHTINEDIKTVVYLRGSTIHNFLNSNENYNKQYCLVATFNQSGGAADLLRARAIPLAITNFSSATKERMLKVEFAMSTSNAASCSGSIYRLNELNEKIDVSPHASGSYVPTDVCPTCNSKIGALNLSLYEINSNTISDISRIPGDTIDLSSIGLRIDTTNNQTTPGPSCTDSSCIASGYSCCLDNQCVTAGEMKPNPDANDLALALAEVTADSTKYTKWPSVYFVCPNITPTDPDPADPTDPTVPADEDFNTKLAQYNCLEGAKKDVPDYSTCTPTTDLAGWSAVRLDVWRKCGCEADPFPTDANDPSCVDYGLKTILNANGSISAIECDVPPAVVVPTPFTGEVTFSSRSAPHRFFNSDGTNYDDLEALATSAQSDSSLNTTQEGEEFVYLDDSSKREPIDTTFAMNAILGQMGIELSRALPAKQLDVTQSQTYVLYTTQGLYTPCPQCASDFWFDSFKPFPAVINPYFGSGVQASGFTTSRSDYQSNTSNANYEDNIFGRACFVPPTMLPFSHQKNSDLNTQRRNRLATQAAYWVNGYQKDWYGFNKGAVIGSFNGVNWFVIGSGRRVVASTNKLFLAINAPFADLASPTSFIVKVIEDQGGQTASDHDYDPSLNMLDQKQNFGASCRQYHQCEVDSDCVTRLGWEYTCADVSEYESYWPQFDADGNEVANAEIDTVGFMEIITNGYTGGSSKRCVYRGSGSPCKINYNSDGLTDNEKELFTCAPNFYCAPITSNDFNQMVEREPNKINSILFGQEANVIGRPKNYIGPQGTGTFTSEIQSNMLYNAAIYFSKNTSSFGARDFGVCRPGKALSSTVWEVQHGAKDSSGRTDYVSQVGSCNSATYPATSTDYTRTASCPAFDSDGNYIYDSGSLQESHLQNMCGAQSQYDDGSGFVSSFAGIEGVNIGSLSNLLQESVVKDACIRRPGSVCHTDLDCSPNRLHVGESNFLSQVAFGDTEAEQKFWEESLVCGQAATKPTAAVGSEDAWDFSQNRCCREIGSDITMFTAGDTTIIPTNTNNTKLDINGGANAQNWINPHPQTEGRYNRFSGVSTLEYKTTVTSSETPYAQIPAVSATEVPKAFQWKALNDAGKLTCCGGGWIRKFNDGTTNWATAKDKLSLNVENFQCLNYQTKTYKENPTGVDADNYNQGLNMLCFDPQNNNGCAQVPIPQSTGFELDPPTNALYTTATWDTSPDEAPSSGSSLKQVDNLSSQVPYQPIAVANPTAMSSSSGPFNYFADPLFNYGVSVALPTYFTPVMTGNDFTTGNISNVIIVYYGSGGSTEVNITANFLSNCPNHNTTTNVPTTWQNPVNDLTVNNWCMAKDQFNIYDVMHVTADPTVTVGGNIWEYAGLKVEFTPQNALTHNPAVAAINIPLAAGNDLYYLTKLARLELLGIPQIHYEPIYCNDDKENLVEGIFDLAGSETRTQFNSESITYTPATWGGVTLAGVYDEGNVDTDDSRDGDGQIVLKNKIAKTDIFSADQFKCCVELGQATPSSANCCSSHAVDGICKLPEGTNIFVYFNKFVSGDGMGDEQPGGGLVDDDFIPQTGEPKMRQSTYDKLSALGQAYCDSGSIRTGGSFGKFYAQPNNGTISQHGDAENARFYSIVDTATDYEDSNGTTQGMQAFLDGYRWDHHMYCAPN